MDSQVRSSALRLISLAIEEDIGRGDITCLSLSKLMGDVSCQIILKEDSAVVCGLEIIEMVYQLIGTDISVSLFACDGDVCGKMDVIAKIEGDSRIIFSGERIVLNFLSRLSGIATATYRCVKKLGRDSVIYDTRKTTPSWRLLEKYAVRCGGGKNHRMGLFDMILIKDNHINAICRKFSCSKLDAIEKAIKEAMLWRKKVRANVEIGVEVESFEEAILSTRMGVDIIMLDNMEFDEIEKVCNVVKDRFSVKIEVSGGIGEKDLEKLARMNIDRVSIGRITHSASGIDFSMEVV